MLDALSLLQQHHEPFPLIVVDRTYQVRDLNRGALVLLATVLGLPVPSGPIEPGDVESLGLNLARLTFDPDGAQPHLANFDEVGRQLLWRIQREVLADPDDGEMRELLEELLAMPTVDPTGATWTCWCPSEPALVLHLRSGDLDLRFLTMVTAFQAPQNVAVEHLRIETWFPYDEPTASACRALADPVTLL